MGARPQFVKLAPVAKVFAANAEIDHIIVHTGQHYDVAMSDVFFDGLKIPTPNVHLGVGSASHGVQTGRILAALDPVLRDYSPDWTMVYGDTNSTLAGAIAAAKMNLSVAHLEAGLRSFNRRMPEEQNRVLTDHVSDLLLAPTDLSMVQLAREGLALRSVKVGDVMTDICWQTREIVRGFDVELPNGVGASDPYIVATIHRAENTDSAARLRDIVAALRDLPAPVVLLAHPRLVSRSSSFGIELSGGALRVTAPLGYLQMVRLVMGAAGVVTDSGGLQKEAFLLGVPCTTLRGETEWVETLVDGWNILDPALIHLNQVAVRSRPVSFQPQPFGDGAAAELVAAALLESLVAR